MNRRAPRRAFVAVIVAFGLTAAACSLILDKEKDQCATTADCAKLGAGLTCNAGLCTPAADANAPTDATLPDGALADGGCAPKEPKSSREEFLNERCTDSKCIDFDNCQRLGLCGNDAGLPALVDPPDGGV